eukprot:3529946-Rhodomonas_salina.2
MSIYRFSSDFNITGNQQGCPELEADCESLDRAGRAALIFDTSCLNLRITYVPPALKVMMTFPSTTNLRECSCLNSAARGENREYVYIPQRQLAPQGPSNANVFEARCDDPPVMDFLLRHPGQYTTSHSPSMALAFAQMSVDASASTTALQTRRNMDTREDDKD